MHQDGLSDSHKPSEEGSRRGPHQAARVSLGRDGPKVVARHGDHDAPGRGVGAPGAHRAVRRERLVRAVLVVDALRRRERAVSAAWTSICVFFMSIVP